MLFTSCMWGAGNCIPFFNKASLISLPNYSKRFNLKNKIILNVHISKYTKRGHFMRKTNYTLHILSVLRLT